MYETTRAASDERGLVGGVAIDAEDVARYDRLGDEWWDPRGAMAPLHKINPTRIAYLRDLMTRRLGRRGSAGVDALPLQGLRVLDIGCGGGLLSEPLARLGAQVTGIDPAPHTIAVAARHAAAFDLSIDYRAATAETLAEAGESFDVVLALEVVEHVPRPADFVATLGALVRPGGLMVFSTLNRTPKSFMLAIIGAEYVLRWLPRGTHRWSQFVTPEELAAPIRAAGLRVIERKGMVYDIVGDRWSMSADMDVNYVLAAIRPPATA